MKKLEILENEAYENDEYQDESAMGWIIVVMGIVFLCIGVFHLSSNWVYVGSRIITSAEHYLFSGMLIVVGGLLMVKVTRRGKYMHEMEQAIIRKEYRVTDV